MSKKKKKNRKRCIIISIVLFIMIVLVVVGYYMYNKHQKEIIDMNRVKVSYNNLKIEINDEVLLSSLIKEVTNGELVNGEDKIDTSKLWS